MSALVTLCTVALPARAADDGPLQTAGVARIDVTPEYPVRLTGYASRKTESEGVAQHLWVKALAFGTDEEQPAILITVVVDYSLRLKKEYDASRLWVNAYANDVPCYIASERILKEGGYEGAGAMVFYDKPARLAPGVENLIVGAVHELLPKEFADAGTAPK